MPTKVVVLGSYAVALVMDVAHIPVSGETILASNFRQTWGGKGSDMAVQAARLGADVEFAGIIGTDSYGDDFIRLMRREGIGIKAVRRSLDKATGAGFIIKDAKGENVISVDMGANGLFGIDDLEAHRELIQSADVAIAQFEIPVETAIHGLQIAKSAGAITVLNPAPGCDIARRNLSMVDVLTPNATEARVCLGLDPYVEFNDRDACDRLLSTGCSAVAMTRGERGVLVRHARGFSDVPAIPVDVVDTNGAGDSFTAALAVALGDGNEIDAAVEFAVVAASLSCTSWETIDSYRDRRSIENVINGRRAMKRSASSPASSVKHRP